MRKPKVITIDGHVLEALWPFTERLAFENLTNSIVQGFTRRALVSKATNLRKITYVYPSSDATMLWMVQGSHFRKINI